MLALHVAMPYRSSVRGNRRKPQVPALRDERDNAEWLSNYWGCAACRPLHGLFLQRRYAEKQMGDMSSVQACGLEMKQYIQPVPAPLSPVLAAAFKLRSNAVSQRPSIENQP